MKRRAARIDANQPEIVAAFRRLGFAVAVTSALGDGFPDIAISKGNRTRLVEIKDGSKVPSARQLTDDERQFHENWKDGIEIVVSLADVDRVNREWRNT